MAAAALYKSRGAAGVRAIKGPFFIFTLLCLVGLASSLISRDQLEKLKKNLHKAQEQMESLREMRVETTNFFWKLEQQMDSMKDIKEKFKDSLLLKQQNGNWKEIEGGTRKLYWKLGKQIESMQEMQDETEKFYVKLEQQMDSIKANPKLDFDFHKEKEAFMVPWEDIIWRPLHHDSLSMEESLKEFDLSSNETEQHSEL